MLNIRKKICIIATTPFPLLVFMRPHIEMLSKYYDVTLISSGSKEELASLLNDRVRFIHVNISRKISLWKDLTALFKLYSIFKKNNFNVVHSLMPKTGLLAMIASFMARIPVRIHTFTGQVWAIKKGYARIGLKLLDKLVAKCATHLLTDSPSQKQFLIDQSITNSGKLVVLADGSVCGIDIIRFKPNSIVRSQVRNDLKIPENAVVYLFLGRLNRDKGIQDLGHAFFDLAINYSNIHLLVVGPDEEDMDEALQYIKLKFPSRFHRIGYTTQPENYMACADIFCLPSYREGFGVAVIEAAAVGIPTVASDIYGLSDSIKNGRTGILHDPGNILELKQALLILTTHNKLRAAMSTQAMARAKSLFNVERLVMQMSSYYTQILK